MKNLDYKKVEAHIVGWLKDYAVNAKKSGFVVGISGGIDSAVVSTLCAKTGLKLYTLQLPIGKRKDDFTRASNHNIWLIEKFQNVFAIENDLTETFNSFMEGVQRVEGNEEHQCLAEANTKSRLRMVSLYYSACLYNCLVVGTGNKVEDFGLQFFTKFGDGACDLSPIGDLMKSEVRALGKYMGVSEDIINAVPSDGLWEDGRGDETQLGATYDELEWVMNWIETNPLHFSFSPEQLGNLSKREQEIIRIYKGRHFANQHKMEMPPICNLDSTFNKE